MTLQQFSDIFAVLAIQLRATDVDEVTIRAYYKAMSDLEPELVQMAADRLAQTAPHGEAWFPKTPEWRAMARQVEREREVELVARLRKRAIPLCLTCADTGWREAGGLLAGRVMRCECRDLRRLEVLGRRPMPELPPAPEAA